MVAGRGSLDEPSAAMLAQLLQKPWHWCASAAVRRSFGSLPVTLPPMPSVACLRSVMSSIASRIFRVARGSSQLQRAYEQRRPSMEFLTDGGGPHEVANSCLEQHGYGRGLHYFNA